MSNFERPVEHLGGYWGGDPDDLKEHAEFMVENYINKNKPVKILCACIAYDLMSQAAEEIYKLHAKLEFADIGTERLEGLIHTLRKRIEELDERHRNLLNDYKTLYGQNEQLRVRIEELGDTFRTHIKELVKDQQGLLSRLEHVLTNALNCVRNCRAEDTDE